MASIRMNLLMVVVFATVIVPMMMAVSYSSLKADERLAILSKKNLTTQEIGDLFRSIKKRYLVGIGKTNVQDILDWESEAPSLEECKYEAVELRECYNEPNYNETFKSNLRKFIEPGYIRLMSFCATNFDLVVEASIYREDKERFKSFMDKLDSVAARKIEAHRLSRWFPDDDGITQQRLVNEDRTMRAELVFICENFREKHLEYMLRIEKLQDESELDLSKDVQAKLNAVKSTLVGSCIKTRWPLSFSQVFSEHLKSPKSRCN